MLLLLLAYLGGALTIVSPCILPELPFVFARADRPFVRSGLPRAAAPWSIAARRPCAPSCWSFARQAPPASEPSRFASSTPAFTHTPSPSAEIGADR